MPSICGAYIYSLIIPLDNIIDLTVEHRSFRGSLRLIEWESCLQVLEAST